MSRIVRAQRVNVCTDADLERLATPIPADLPLACGCPRDTAQRQVSEHDVQCDGCGRVSA